MAQNKVLVKQLKKAQQQQNDAAVRGNADLARFYANRVKELQRQMSL